MKNCIIVLFVLSFFACKGQDSAATNYTILHVVRPSGNAFVSFKVGEKVNYRLVNKPGLYTDRIKKLTADSVYFEKRTLAYAQLQSFVMRLNSAKNLKGTQGLALFSAGSAIGTVGATYVLFGSLSTAVRFVQFIPFAQKYYLAIGIPLTAIGTALTIFGYNEVMSSGVFEIEIGKGEFVLAVSN